MRILAFLVLAFALYSCNNKSDDKKILPENIASGAEKPSVQVKILQDKNTIRERFPAPENYIWVEDKKGSFGYFLENFKLKPYGTKILKYDGNPIATQNLHEAVFDIPVGTKDLQQCADAVIRLRADFLKNAGRENEIAFHYTSGDLLKWSDYKKGRRLFVNGNSVTRGQISGTDSSVNSFQNYLDNIFTYAGTISLNRETKPVATNSALKSGDILITPGSPGHVVFIAGVSKNSAGKKLYLLGEGFTPAQSIHILTNPFNTQISPWYDLDVNAPETKTARYHFKPTNFRSF